MKYFGTDGIRQKSQLFLDNEFSINLARAICQTAKVTEVVIGRDTRHLGKEILQQLTKGFNEYGVKVIDIGIIPTPMVAYYTKLSEVDFGIMISASHNPPEYNGIKIFTSQGFKISEQLECGIEQAFISGAKQGDFTANVYEKQDIKNFYKKIIKEFIGRDLKGVKLLLDTAYGATSLIAKEVFEHLGAEVVSINDEYRGELINVENGSTNVENLNVSPDFYLALAFDGDGDRVLCKTAGGKVIDGDIMMYIIALYFKNNNILTNNACVGTILTNNGLNAKLATHGIDLLRTNVGDKYIQQVMVEKGLILGAEQSGHVILNGVVKTGDGILSGAMFIKALLELNIAPDLIDYLPYPQNSVNVKCETNAKAIVSLPKVLAIIDEYKVKAPGVRLIIRPSGTEPIIRLMAEGENESEINEILQELKNIFEIIIKDFN